MFETQFSLDQAEITDTRAIHNDTDFATVSIKIGQNRPLTKTVAMGDVNNGTINLGLTVVAAIPEVNPKETVVFSYVILNRGHTDDSFSAIESALESAVSSLGHSAVQAVQDAAGREVGAVLGAALGTAVVPLLGTALGALGGWFVGKVSGFLGELFKNCDGVVATGVRIHTVEELLRMGGSPNNTESEEVEHIGLDSPCHVSKYKTRTTISVRQGALFDVNGRWASGGTPGPVITLKGNEIFVDMSAYHRPNAWGMFEDDTNFWVKFPDDDTVVGQLQRPNVIKWSNNSTWSKV